MEPTTSFEVPNFYGKRIANSSENSALNDIGECDSFIVNGLNQSTSVIDPEVFDLSLNASLSEGCSDNMTKGQKGKNRKRKLNFESAKDDLNVQSTNTNIIELKGQKGENSKNLSFICDPEVLDLSLNTSFREISSLDVSELNINGENVESEYNEIQENESICTAGISELIVNVASENNEIYENESICTPGISELNVNKKKKGKISIGQMVKNGRKDRDSTIETAKTRVTRHRNAKTEASYFEGDDNEFLGDSDSEDEYLAEYDDLEYVDDEDDYEEQAPTRRPGRPKGSKNRNSRKADFQLHHIAGDDFENESNDNVPEEIDDSTVNGQSGCTSPPKKSCKTSRKRPRDRANWKKLKLKPQEILDCHIRQKM